MASFPFLNHDALAAVGCSENKRKRGSRPLPFVGFEHATCDEVNGGNGGKRRAPAKQAKRSLPRTVLRSEFDAAFTRFVARFSCGSVTLDAQRAVAAYPQHLENGVANPNWLAARTHRVTGSVVPAIAGWNPYSSPEKVLADKLWGGFRGNNATRYGSENEDNAQAAFLAYLRGGVGAHRNAAGHVLVAADITNVGLVVSREFPWAGMSPDGLLKLSWRNPVTGGVETETSLVEYKCPWKRSVRLRAEISAADMYASTDQPLGGGTLPCPPYYYGQIQYGMRLLRGHFIDARNTHAYFVVWSPAGRGRGGPPRVVGTSTPPRAGGVIFSVSTPHGLIQVCRVPYNDTAGQYLIKNAEEFWKKKYAPAAVLKDLGALEHGEVHPTISFV